MEFLVRVDFTTSGGVELGQKKGEFMSSGRSGIWREKIHVSI